MASRLLQQIQLYYYFAVQLIYVEQSKERCQNTFLTGFRIENLELFFLR